MKNKLILWLSVVLLIVLIAFMAKDLFTSNERTQQNVYEYDLNSLREVDESQISHKEIKQIRMNADEAHAIAVDANDNIYVGTDKNVLVFNSEGKQINSLKLRETAYCLTVLEDGNMVVGMKKRIDSR
jgi:sugar lactone lactonase YvrE